MKPKVLNFFISSDDNYAEHMHTCIYSIAYNLNKNCKADIYILDWGITDIKLKKIKNIEQEFPNITIKIKHITDDKYSKIDSKHLTKEAYFRIDAPLFFDDLYTIIYMDCDIVVDRDLSDLIDLELWNNIIWAPNDFWASCYYHYKLGIPNDFWFFNTWFLIMNLKLMRKNGISEKIFSYLKSNIDNIVACDQDAINAVCYDKRLVLPLKYNATALAFQPINWNFPRKEYYEAKHNPVIIHYACAKPWNRWCFHPKRKLYHKYRKLAWLPDIKYPKWFDFPRLRKSIFEVIWNFLIAAIPCEIYHHIIWKPKMFLSKFIKF